MSWCVRVLTLYPEMFPGSLGHSLAGKGLLAGLWSLDVVNIRDFALDAHRSVDDTPAGGGPGMVMRPDVVARAVDCLKPDDGRRKIYLTPRGVPLRQTMIRDLIRDPGVVLLCGRFEGVDQRIVERRGFEEVSIGDYVLSGGELAAFVLIDACVRLLPGIMGAEASSLQESFEGGLLEYPHYTRPQMFEGETIPDVLLSGHHGKIAEWRRLEAEKLTKIRRPDLWQEFIKKNS